MAYDVDSLLHFLGSKLGMKTAEAAEAPPAPSTPLTRPPISVMSYNDIQKMPITDPQQANAASGLPFLEPFASKDPEADWNQVMTDSLSGADSSHRHYSFDPKSQNYYDDEMTNVIPSDKYQEAIQFMRGMDDPALAAMKRGR